MGGREGAFALATLGLLLLRSTTAAAANSRCILFNFGDSNSDTGGLMAGLGLYRNPPSGRLFFHRSTGRFCDGRLYIDFICERLQMSLLSHYLESSGSTFSDGANFAVAGAETAATASIPFSLSTQVLQFLHFKNRTRELRPRGSGSMITEKEFREAVHSIDIGQNDVSYPFASNFTYMEVIQNIPTIISRIRDAVVLLYEHGGRKFWVYNTGPFGCLPQMLSLLKKNDSKLDPAGCLADFNNAAQVFNAGLSDLCDQLRSDFENATIVYTDMYAIKYDLIVNHSKYGFDHPLMACCGYGGPPYNYKSRMSCGEPNITAFDDGSRYISWDGVHSTEAANSIIASKILSAKYSRPQIKLKHLCRS